MKTFFARSFRNCIVAFSLLQSVNSQAQINSSGLLFDGVDDYATIPNNAAYNFGTGDFTIEMWVRMYFYQKNSIQYAYLLTNNTGAGGISIFLGISHNFIVNIGTDSYNFSHNLNDNLCHHVALVRSGTSVMFYVDGNLMQTVTKPAVSNVGITTNAIRLGADIMFGNSFYTGFMHELRFWNIARSQANIQGTMNIGLSGSELGLIGYWKCNDLSGQVINDYSPTNNDGQRGSTQVLDLQDPEFISGCSNCALPSSGTITAGGPTSFCQGGSVVLTAPPSYTYYWIGLVPYPSNNRNQTFTATSPANYACIIGNNCGNIISNFIPVSIITGTAIVTASGPTTYCAPGSVTLNANTGTGLTYQWGNDNVAIPGATASSYTVTNLSGHYYCTVTTGGCGTTSNVITISVVTSAPPASISANGLTTFCPGGNVSMIANSGTGFTYQWRQNATPIPGATSQLYSTGAAGSYDCLVTNICGTSTSNSIAVNYSTTCSGGLLFSSSNNNRVTINNNAAYNFGTGDFTIETWVKAAVGQTNSFPTIISTRQTTTSGFRIFLSNGRFRFQLGNVVSSFEAGPLLSDNNCHHLALTRTGTTVNMYVDGILVLGQTGFNQDVNSTHALWIGADEPAAPLNFNGVINDVRLWNITKTQAQIQASSNFYLTGSEAGLVGYWKMNDGSGQTVQDLSPTLNNGVLGSTSAVESIDPAFTTTGCIPACNTTASITSGGPTTFCTPGSVTLNANTGIGLSYQWRKNSVAISGATNSSYIAIAGGNYDCVVTSTCGNATSNSITVTVNTVPPATISAGGPTTFCSGGSVTLSANTGTGLTYQWRSNNVDISGATNSSYVVSTSENYDCVVSNVCGNVASNSIAVVVDNLPTATITAGGSVTFCTPGTVTLSANTGAGLTYQWKLNGVNISSATSSSYVVSAGGNYTCVVSNTCGNVPSNSIAVTVNNPPTATITAGGPTTFCSPGSVTLSANTGTGLTYQWRMNAVNISGATSSSYVATTSGIYDCVVSNVCGNTPSNSFFVIMILPPTAAITAGGPVTFCSPGSVTLSANTGSGLTYQWRQNTVNISGATNSSYVVATGGNYDCVVSNSCGNTPSNSIAVTVNTVPPATISAGGSTSFCSPGSVALNANTGTGLSYQWRQNTVNISGATNSSYVATVGGNYDCVVSNVCGSVPSNSIGVTVNTLPSATISAGGSTTFCTGGSVTLNANTGTGLTYQWRLNNTGISGATLSSFTATSAGNYDCIVSNSCGSSTSNAIAITVNTTPPATITAGGTTTFCTGGSVSINANTGGGLTYQWRLNGNNISGASLSSYSANATGNYTCVVSNNCGGTTSNTITVTVNTTPSTPGTITGPATGVCSSTKAYSIAAVPGATSYTWTSPAGATIASGQGTTTANISFTGTFTGGLVSVVTVNTCGSSAASSLSVTGAPAQPGSITGPVSVCHNQNNVVYSIATVAGATSYTWTVPAGTQIKQGQGTVSIKVRFGNSAGNVTVKANNGCGSSSLRTLAVAMPCRDQEDEVFENSPVITVYPNPSGMQFNFRVDAPGIEKYSLKIFDITGRMVESYESLSVKEEFSCGNTLKNGIYIGEVMLGNTKKLLRLIKSE